MEATEGIGAPITNRGAKTGPGRDPIRIQAQVLREWQAVAPPASSGGFGFALPEKAQNAASARKTTWRKADLKRAIAVAEEAGLKSFRVEISPDGTITIIVDSAEG